MSVRQPDWASLPAWMQQEQSTQGQGVDTEGDAGLRLVSGAASFQVQCICHLQTTDFRPHCPSVPQGKPPPTHRRPFSPRRAGPPPARRQQRHIHTSRHRKLHSDLGCGRDSEARASEPSRTASWLPGLGHLLPGTRQVLTRHPVLSLLPVSGRTGLLQAPSLPTGPVRLCGDELPRLLLHGGGTQCGPRVGWSPCLGWAGTSSQTGEAQAPSQRAGAEGPAKSHLEWRVAWEVPEAEEPATRAVRAWAARTPSPEQKVQGNSSHGPLASTR